MVIEQRGPECAGNVVHSLCMLFEERRLCSYSIIECQGLGNWMRQRPDGLVVIHLYPISILPNSPRLQCRMMFHFKTERRPERTTQRVQRHQCSFRPFLPASSAATLLQNEPRSVNVEREQLYLSPLLFHLGHFQHRCSPLLQSAFHGPFPEMTLDTLPSACALHP